MMSCCLCREDVSSSNRRKQLHGNSCADARGVLLQELSGCSLDEFEETSDPAAWMCYKCQVKLKKLNEARNLVDEVSRLLSGLKRTADSDSVPLAKRPHYSVQPSICPDVSANS